MTDMTLAEPEAPTPDETTPLASDGPTTVQDREIRLWLSAIAALLVQIAVTAQPPADAPTSDGLTATMDHELATLLTPNRPGKTVDELCQLAVSQELPAFLARSGLSPLVVMWWKAVSLEWLDVPRTEARREAISAVRAWAKERLQHTPAARIDHTWRRLAAITDLTHTEAEGLRWAMRCWRENPA